MAYFITPVPPEAKISIIPSSFPVQVTGVTVCVSVNAAEGSVIVT